MSDSMFCFPTQTSQIFNQLNLFFSEIKLLWISFSLSFCPDVDQFLKSSGQNGTCQNSCYQVDEAPPDSST